MPEVLEQTNTRNFPAQNSAESYTSTVYEGVYYPEEREDDMGETSIHISLITELLQILKLFFKDRQDVFLSSNLNVYYKEGNPHRWFAPDLLVAFGVPNVERSSYLLWREEIFPQVIFEIASDKTWRKDVVEKFGMYEKFGAEEYYILDSEFAFLPAPLMAFHRKGGKLVEAEVKDDRIFSPRLGLEIVRTEKTFRLFNPNTNEFLRTLEEAENERKQAETELNELKAEIEKLKAEKNSLGGK